MKEIRTNLQKQHSVKSEIIKLINDKQQCAFGDIIKELNYSYSEILGNVIELQEQGKIKKSRDYQGNYIIA
jgi:DeoR/GlpR family transcriptional regulator of sugar metabolism